MVRTNRISHGFEQIVFPLKQDHNMCGRKQYFLTFIYIGIPIVIDICQIRQFSIIIGIPIQMTQRRIAENTVRSLHIF